jgi:PEGA domain
MTEVVESVSPQGDKRSRLGYSLKPLVFGALGAGALLIWDAYRHTSVQFGVSVDIGTLQGASATMDGKPFVPGTWAAPGHRKIVVGAVDADPVEREFFLWLGSHNIGEFQLHRSRGDLSVGATPAPLEVSIKGEFTAKSSKAVPAEFRSIPVGRYEVIAAFEHSREEKQVEVVRNQTTRLDLKPNLGALSLSTAPGDADFNLSGWSGQEIRLKGKTPAVLNQLPAGQYVLQVARQDYRKELRVDVKPGETNEIKVSFEYAEVSVATDPEGATILLNNKESGQTPKTITELRPGQYQVRLEKEGFAPVATFLQVKGNESITIATNLTSQAYLAAMESARKLGNAVPADYERALQTLEEALKIKPGDTEATTLKESLVRAQSIASENKQAAEIAARRLAVLNAFQNVTDGEQDAALFDTYTWSFAGRADALKDAVLRSMQREPVLWVLKSDQNTDEQSYLVTCTGKRLAGKYSHASVLLTQFSPQEVIMHAKFWVYMPKPGEELSWLIHGREGLMPLHPKSYSPDQKERVEQQRKGVAEDFKKKLMSELN